MEARYRRRVLSRRLQRPSPEQYEGLDDDDDNGQNHRKNGREKENSAPRTSSSRSRSNPPPPLLPFPSSGSTSIATSSPSFDTRTSATTADNNNNADNNHNGPPQNDNSSTTQQQYRVTLGGSRRSSFGQYPETYERDGLPTTINTSSRRTSSAGNQSPLAETPPHRYHNNCNSSPSSSSSKFAFDSLQQQQQQQNHQQQSHHQSSPVFKADFNADFNAFHHNNNSGSKPPCIRTNNNKGGTPRSSRSHCNSEEGGGDPPSLARKQQIESPRRAIPSPRNLDSPARSTALTRRLERSSGRDTPSPRRLESPASAASATSSRRLERSARDITPSPRRLERSARDTPSPRNLERSARDTPSPSTSNRSTRETPSPRKLDRSARDTPSPRKLEKSARDTLSASRHNSPASARSATSSPIRLERPARDTPSPSRLERSARNTPSPSRIDSPTTAGAPPSQNKQKMRPNQLEHVPFDERENRRRLERERILRLMNGLDALLVETPTNAASAAQANSTTNSAKRPPIPIPGGTPEQQLSTATVQQAAATTTQTPAPHSGQQEEQLTRKEEERAKIKSLMRGLDQLLMDTPPSSAGKVAAAALAAQEEEEEEGKEEAILASFKSSLETSLNAVKGATPDPSVTSSSSSSSDVHETEISKLASKTNNTDQSTTSSSNPSSGGTQSTRSTTEDQLRLSRQICSSSTTTKTTASSSNELATQKEFSSNQWQASSEVLESKKNDEESSNMTFSTLSGESITIASYKEASTHSTEFSPPPGKSASSFSYNADKSNLNNRDGSIEEQGNNPESQSWSTRSGVKVQTVATTESASQGKTQLSKPDNQEQRQEIMTGRSVFNNERRTPEPEEEEKESTMPNAKPTSMGRIAEASAHGQEDTRNRSSTFHETNTGVVMTSHDRLSTTDERQQEKSSFSSDSQLPNQSLHDSHGDANPPQQSVNGQSQASYGNAQGSSFAGSPPPSALQRLPDDPLRYVSALDCSNPNQASSTAQQYETETQNVSQPVGVENSIPRFQVSGPEPYAAGDQNAQAETNGHHQSMQQERVGSTKPMTSMQDRQVNNHEQLLSGEASCCEDSVRTESLLSGGTSWEQSTKISSLYGLKAVESAPPPTHQAHTYQEKSSSGTAVQQSQQYRPPFEAQLQAAGFASQSGQQSHLYQEQSSHEMMTAQAAQNQSQFHITSLSLAGSSTQNQFIHQGQFSNGPPGHSPFETTYHQSASSALHPSQKQQMYYEQSRYGLPAQRATQNRSPFEGTQLQHVGSATQPLQQHQMYNEQLRYGLPMQGGTQNNYPPNENMSSVPQSVQRHQVWREQTNNGVSAHQTTTQNYSPCEVNSAPQPPQQQRIYHEQSNKEISPQRHSPVEDSAHIQSTGSALPPEVRPTHSPQQIQYEPQKQGQRILAHPESLAEEPDFLGDWKAQAQQSSINAEHSKHLEPVGYSMISPSLISPVLPPPRHYKNKAGSKGRQDPEALSPARQPGALRYSDSQGSQRPPQKSTGPAYPRHHGLPLHNSTSLGVRTDNITPSPVRPVARKVLARSIESQEAQFHHGTNDIADKRNAPTPLAKTKHSRYYRGGKFQDGEATNSGGPGRDDRKPSPTPKRATKTPNETRQRTPTAVPKRRDPTPTAKSTSVTNNDDDLTVATTTVTMASEYLGSRTYSSGASSDEDDEDEEEGGSMGKAFTQNVMGMFESIKMPSFANCVTSTRGVLESMAAKSERVTCIKATPAETSKTEEKQEKRRTKKDRRRKSTSAIDTSRARSSRRGEQMPEDDDTLSTRLQDPNGLQFR